LDCGSLEHVVATVGASLCGTFGCDGGDFDEEVDKVEDMDLWVRLVLGLSGRWQIVNRTYSAYNSCTLANVRDITKRFGISSKKRVSDSKSRSRDISTAIDNRRANDVSVHSVLRTSLKHESIRLAIEHLLMNSFDVILLRIIPNFTLRIEVARSTVIDPIACTTNVDQLALRTGDFCFLASDDGGDEVASERIAGVDGDVVLFA
jgi:hypothetical protein